MSEVRTRPLVFFDGLCNLCNRAVLLILKFDKKKQFDFASLQSVKGRAALDAISIAGELPPDSILLYYQSKYYMKSAAVLKIFDILGGVWTLFSPTKILPVSVRDRIYDLVARRRYKWFGQKDSCMVPTPELKERFISE